MTAASHGGDASCVSILPIFSTDETINDPSYHTQHWLPAGIPSRLSHAILHLDSSWAHAERNLHFLSFSVLTWTIGAMCWYLACLSSGRCPWTHQLCETKDESRNKQVSRPEKVHLIQLRLGFRPSSSVMRLGSSGGMEYSINCFLILINPEAASCGRIPMGLPRSFSSSANNSFGSDSNA
ncbi:hypothetical protein SISSUDRAFT_422403 [Sistotremastrum suecicum HHB10207 ss-3]|uniref:Uncharacterized protein n=1 Tax=Sistotremastrum suecicum HHB10207 ss-3 TaxID=1314776 RepID=A0A165YK81_9AGAM|nr:hypothetical protein SISSUDRAFT_422403 [Sistotremastrum suecicum HHB10207 ss-3]